MFYVYATTFNNADTVDRSLMSIAPLKPKKIFVVDNFSLDDTLSRLKRHGDVVVMQERCRRGAGRGMALEMLLKEADDGDTLVYIDLDTAYKEAWIRHIRHLTKTIRHGQISIFGMMSTAKTNRNLPWADLNNAEDIERLARAKYQGCHIIDLEFEKLTLPDSRAAYSNPYFDNGIGAGELQSSREKRYTTNGIARFVRLVSHVIEGQRGGAYKSFRKYYSICKEKSAFNYLAFFMGYHLANLVGTYSYDDKKSNNEFIRS